MGEQVEKRFTWILKKFSTLEDECCYSRPFTFAGWNWHISAYPKGYGNCRHLSVFVGLVNPESLPSGWRREVKFRLTLVNKKYISDTTELEGQRWFDASTPIWGLKEFLPLSTVRYRDNGFLVGDKLIFFAQLHVFPAIVAPTETVKIMEQPLSSQVGIQAADASVNNTQEVASYQVVRKTENAASQENVDYDLSKKNSCVNTSQEDLDDDDGGSEEYSDDDEEGYDDASKKDLDGHGDTSSPVSEDVAVDRSSLEQSNALVDASHIVENHGVRCNSVAAETVVSNGENDGAPKEDVDVDDDSSFVLIDGARDVSSPDQVKSSVGTSQTVENGGRGFNTVASVTETCNTLLKEIQPVKDTLDVYGFEVYSAQVEKVTHIFERHPSMAFGFRPKNQQIRRAYMNQLLSLIETLCQSPEKLSEDDLSNADDTLVDLIDAGFKLDWLKTKLNEVSEKKKKEQGSEVRLQTMEEQLQKLKLMVLDLETQMQKEKVEALAARVPLSFKDVVC